MSDQVINDGTPVASPGQYATVQEVRDYRIAGNKVKDLFKYTNDEISDRIETQSAIIDGITGDVFSERTETNKFDGNGLYKLFFPPEVPYRNLTVTSVTEMDIDGATLLHTYEEGEDFVRYEYYLDMDLGIDYDRPRVRFGRGGTWPLGQKNIWIAGTWGRATTPVDIKEAVILLTLEALIPGSSQMSNADIRKAEWDDFSVTFKGSDTFGQATGFLAVDRILQRHINHSGMFIAVPDKRTDHSNGPGTYFRI
jgi:hypothetical protein